MTAVISTPCTRRAWVVNRLLPLSGPAPMMPRRRGVSLRHCLIAAGSTGFPLSRRWNMLQALRSTVGSWIVKILFVLLILSFGVWGIGDISRGRTDTTAAEVGT